MDRKVRAALERSIRHWERIRDGRDRYIGSGSCALCGLFLDGGEGNCSGCPVYADSGATHCWGTPYEEFVKFHIELRDRGLRFSALRDEPGQKRLYQRRVLLAQAEIDYLESLRPPRRRRKETA